MQVVVQARNISKIVSEVSVFSVSSCHSKRVIYLSSPLVCSHAGVHCVLQRPCPSRQTVVSVAEFMCFFKQQEHERLSDKHIYVVAHHSSFKGSA